MTDRTCSVVECDRPSKTRGWCKSHYMFWYRTGETPTGPIERRDPGRGCSVEGCDRPFAAIEFCAPHHKRYLTFGSPLSADIRPRVIPPEGVTYELAHNRVQKRNGPARLRSCVQCGERARHWAYDHEDPAEKVDERGYAFSADIDHYRPMCVPCHKRFDMARLNAAPLQTLGSE